MCSWNSTVSLSSSCHARRLRADGLRSCSGMRVNIRIRQENNLFTFIKRLDKRFIQWHSNLFTHRNQIWVNVDYHLQCFFVIRFELTWDGTRRLQTKATRHLFLDVRCFPAGLWACGDISRLTVPSFCQFIRRWFGISVGHTRLILNFRMIKYLTLLLTV